jgi:hypothetical protein
MVQFFYRDKIAPQPTLAPSVDCNAFIKKNEKYLFELRFVDIES